jgi:outer membrane protein assembly factor BamB
MFSPSPSDRLTTARSRIGSVALAAVLALTGLACGSVFGDEAEADWSFGPHMTHRRSYPASAVIDGKIYVAAGMVGETGKPLDFLERFDPERNQWTSLTPLPRSFSAAAGASLDGRLWVIGGDNSPEADGRQVYSYDVASDRWQEETPLPVTRMNLAAVTFDGKIYAIGGLDPAHPTKTVFVYDPATERWSRGTPMPVALHAHSASVYRGEIWVFGGRDRSVAQQRGVWIYSPESDRWRRGPSLPEPMDTLSTAVSDDQIHALVDDHYFIYDGERWERGPTLTRPRHALAVYTIGDTLWAIGGCLYPQLQDSTVVEKIPADL